MPASVSDAQYRAGGWDYLESKDEPGLYLAICAPYQRYLHGHTGLDIGYGTGILNRHLVERTGMQSSLYAGKDLSEKALNLARNRFPEASFEHVTTGPSRSICVSIVSCSMRRCTASLKRARSNTWRMVG